MNMRIWPLVLAAVIVQSDLTMCQKFPLESARHSYNGNLSQNICHQLEEDALYSHSSGGKLRNNDNEILDVMKRKFIGMGGNRVKTEFRKDELHDDPNVIQALMSRAFIDNANLVFHKSDVKDDDSIIFGKHSYQILKYPRIKKDLAKDLCCTFRDKRAIFNEQVKNSDDDDVEDTFNEVKSKTKYSDDSEMRVHCVRAGPTEVVCRHENYSFNFKLPPDLFDKKIMENLVSSVCTIIEEASPNGKGKVEISIKKRGKFVKKLKELSSDKPEIREPKEDLEKVVNKVIRINIPIDFSAIPLGVEDSDKPFNDRIESKQSIDEDNSLVLDKSSEQLVKHNKFQLAKNEESQGSNADKENEMQDLVKSSNSAVEGTDMKWVNKRESLHNPMVFPPSLILFKRSPDKQPDKEIRSEPSVTDTSCKMYNIEQHLLTGYPQPDPLNKLTVQ